MKKLLLTFLFLIIGICVIKKMVIPSNIQAFGVNPPTTNPNGAVSPKINPYVTKDKVFCITSNPKDGSTEDSASGLIYTAIGCIPVSNTSSFIEWILRWAIGIGGGISLMLIIVASFQILTSSGNPEKVQAGKELLTSAIAGLIMLIFSVFILKIIGVDILKLPGIN